MNSLGRAQRRFNSNPLIGPLIVNVWFIYFWISHYIKTGETFTIWLSVLAAFPFFFIANQYSKSLKTPLIEIFETEIQVQNIWGKVKKVAPLNDYDLVFSSDFIAFRKGKENDITLNLGMMRRSKEKEIIRLLEKMDFKSIIGNAKAH